MFRPSASKFLYSDLLTVRAALIRQIVIPVLPPWLLNLRFSINDGRQAIHLNPYQAFYWSNNLY